MAGGPPIIDLFNGTDLTGWTVYQQQNNSQTTPGMVLTGAAATRIFKPEGGTIRVYGDLPGATEPGTTDQARHTMVSDGSYSKYNFFLEYRWGTKKFRPYPDPAMHPRDAGILFHLHGNKATVWPWSIEFQIMDGSVGDIYTILALCTSLARPGATGVFVEAADGGVMTAPFGSASSYVRHRRLNVNVERPDWNSLEMHVDGRTAVFIVNGRIVNRVFAIAARSGGTAVTSGPIALQAEHAEVFYRNIRIQVLP